MIERVMKFGTELQAALFDGPLAFSIFETARLMFACPGPVAALVRLFPKPVPIPAVPIAGRGLRMQGPSLHHTSRMVT